MMMLQSKADMRPLRLLRLASLAEGTTLLVLLGFAVPLKHLAGLPLAVTLIGPLHGVAFLFYMWLAISIVTAEDWTGSEIWRVLGAALIPFGTFLNAGFLRRKERELAAAESARGNRQ